MRLPDPGDNFVGRSPAGVNQGKFRAVAQVLKDQRDLPAKIIPSKGDTVWRIEFKDFAMRWTERCLQIYAFDRRESIRRACT